MHNILFFYCTLTWALATSISYTTRRKSLDSQTRFDILPLINYYYCTLYVYNLCQVCKNFTYKTLTFSLKFIPWSFFLLRYIHQKKKKKSVAKNKDT